MDNVLPECSFSKRSQHSSSITKPDIDRFGQFGIHVVYFDLPLKIKYSLRNQAFSGKCSNILLLYCHNRGLGPDGI